MRITAHVFGALCLWARARLGCGGDGSSSAPSAADAASSDSTPSTDAAAPSGAIAELVQMCKMVHACGYTTARFGVPADVCLENALSYLELGYEVDSPEQRNKYQRMASCAAKETSCDAFVKCADYDGTCSGSATPSCKGSILDRCSTPGGNHLPRIFDCAALGQTCEGGACVIAPGSPDCDDPSGGRCDGDDRIWCRPRAGGGNGETAPEPCPTGTTCVENGGNLVCAPAIETCAAERFECEGDDVVLCRKQGGVLQEMRIRCGAVGRKCAPDAKGNPACLPVASECAVPGGDDKSSKSTCEGANVSVCLDGVKTTLDCAAHGMGPCMNQTPVVGAPYAGCTSPVGG